MPLPMVHLNIAIELLESGFKTSDLSQFYLGIISPDAIHMRKDTISEDKRKTHLSENVKWIDINDTDFYELMLAFIKSNIDNVNHDFLWGYVLHIITDMHWSKIIYPEFVEKYRKDTIAIQDERMAYYNDTDRLDQIIFNECNWRNDVWEYLGIANCTNFLDILTGYEINLWKNRTLHWFDSGESQHKNPIKYILKTDIEEFIYTCNEKILRNIKKV